MNSEKRRRKRKGSFYNADSEITFFIPKKVVVMKICNVCVNKCKYKYLKVAHFYCKYFVKRVKV